VGEENVIVPGPEIFCQVWLMIFASITTAVREKGILVSKSMPAFMTGAVVSGDGLGDGLDDAFSDGLGDGLDDAFSDELGDGLGDGSGDKLDSS
jgi:hypothetical protein